MACSDQLKFFKFIIFITLTFSTLYAAKLDYPPLEVGDLVFRKGLGAEALVINKLSTSPYTHIAMVIQTNPTLLIHATTDDDKTKLNQVILSSLEDFAAHGTKVAIKRLKFSKEQKRQIAHFAKKELGRKFILSADKEAFYCTNFIENSIQKVIKDFKLERKYVDVAIVNGDYLFPKAFFDDEKSFLIYESNEY